MQAQTHPSRVSCFPIGYVRSPKRLKHHLPSQPFDADRVQKPLKASIELLPEHQFDQALEGLEGFEYVWILSWMDQACNHGLQEGTKACYYNKKAKVSPPGREKKVGVFATRSPHHPNPIGLSCVRLLAIEGRTLLIEGCDLLEGTPVLDIKPYVRSADAKSEAACGWIDQRQSRLEKVPWQLLWSEKACRALELLKGDAYLQKEAIERALRFGPLASSSNRLRRKSIAKEQAPFEGGTFYELALGPWRVLLSQVNLQSKQLAIEAIYSGYERAGDIEDSSERARHLLWILNSL